mgnify:FL=1
MKIKIAGTFVKEKSLKETTYYIMILTIMVSSLLVVWQNRQTKNVEFCQAFDLIDHCMPTAKRSP